MTEQLEASADIDDGHEITTPVPTAPPDPAQSDAPPQGARRGSTRPPTPIIAGVALTVITAALLMGYLGSDGVYFGLVVAVAALLVAVGLLERQRLALYGVLVLAALSVLSAAVGLLDAPVTSVLRGLAGAGVAALLLVPEESRQWFAVTGEPAE